MKDGLLFNFISLLIVSGFIIVMIQRARGGLEINLRSIAGIEAMEEAVGRATEMGRIVHFSPGIAALSGTTAAQTFAGLETLGYLAKLVARYGARLIVTIRQPTVLPLAEEVVRQAYMAEGAIEAYDEDSVQYLSSEQFAYAAGAMGIINREKAAANVLLGAFWAESLMLVEAAFHAGSISICGTAMISQVPFFVAASDYTLIGEELYAAGAICSGNPVRLGSIAGQDYGKLYALALLVIGSLAATAGSNFLADLIAK
jgi:hypothetical protein